ncbi:DNA glycosylase AlkZ-like family protein [Streptantibioticus cattleyicolor]|uniref:Winged helix DNA-binding domain-containing protein n=1 Tax=Streptantibioticus cattleyicolor (strain ATCC 35852 / DSM 46488 / JCM 4925 / NBRC 14057 / NRRL 8057) TaxID=1003195 RepID=F8JL16_STREN|nr:crosslink repair DNA glycosylase YcaQ family protein [Streptantibioticus cattleyicolor]AEW98404.1 hypothetical protein SCATT_p02110 [Streptantibioticus cattleyicolor NRRL 8057 = DSM 46488]CCB72536.1 protein of unknown function [Streptantibioticus cattleyicolor NRRL 8057 = DSM 46488]
MPVLSTRALGRATPARQYLLDRADVPVPEAVAQLCGVQAQAPQEPPHRAVSRLRAFSPDRLDHALTGRQVVRTHLTRCTVHLVAWRARHDAAGYRGELDGVDLDEVAAAGRAVMADDRPRSMTELVREGRDRWPGPPVSALGELLVAALVPMAQLPPRGLRKSPAGVRNLTLTATTGRPTATSRAAAASRRSLRAMWVRGQSTADVPPRSARWCRRPPPPAVSRRAYAASRPVCPWFLRGQRVVVRLGLAAPRAAARARARTREGRDDLDARFPGLLGLAVPHGREVIAGW